MLELCVKESYTSSKESLNCPEEAYKLAKSKLKGADREQFLCFHLDVKNRVKSFEVVSIGTLNMTLIHPREVFKAAILANAASIIVAHNHPSGDAEPSQDDIVLTKRLVEAGKILGIELMDHIVISNESYLSLREKGVIY